MSSWKWPQLINKISEDIPYLQSALNALLKMNPTSISDIPIDAKRLADMPNNSVQLQKYNNTSWDSCGKLIHDVDMLDGKHANTGTVADTIPVRNANGEVPGDITGNAATATSAVALSEVNPVAKGGTGATTSAGARANLSVAPIMHKSDDVKYGVGDDDEYGHLKLFAGIDSNSGTNGGVAATPSAVKTVDERAVHTFGDQQISGTKTFTGALDSTGVIRVINTSREDGVIPSSDVAKDVYITDKNGRATGFIRNGINALGHTYTQMWVKQNGTENYNRIGIANNPSTGEFITYAPTPISSGSANQIATTGWVSSFVQDAVSRGTFVGEIKIWSGSFSGVHPVVGGSVLLNWQICDGSNGTPNLVNRFILGSATTGAGEVGGAWTHGHTSTASVSVQAHVLTINEMPSHSHSIQMHNRHWAAIASHDGAFNDLEQYGGPIWTDAAGGNAGHSHGASASVTTYEASSLPPYYKLAYIMRLS